MANIVLDRKTAEAIVEHGTQAKRTSSYSLPKTKRQKRYRATTQQREEQKSQDTIRMVRIYRDFSSCYPTDIDAMESAQDEDAKKIARFGPNEKTITLPNGGTRIASRWNYDKVTGLWKIFAYLLDQNGISETGERIEVYSFICVEPIYDYNENYWGPHNNWGYNHGWGDSCYTNTHITSEFVREQDKPMGWTWLANDYYNYEDNGFRMTNTGLNQLPTQRFMVIYMDNRWNLFGRLNMLSHQSWNVGENTSHLYNDSHM